MYVKFTNTNIEGYAKNYPHIKNDKLVPYHSYECTLR